MRFLCFANWLCIVVATAHAGPRSWHPDRRNADEPLAEFGVDAVNASLIGACTCAI